jgi:hypothetical protein
MAIFGKKYTVTFYMKSGNQIEMGFDSFEISKLSGKGDRSIEWKGSSSLFTIDVDQIECCIIKD